MIKSIVVALAALVMAEAVFVVWPAHAAEPPQILPMKERAEIRDRLLLRRLDTVVPALMRREGIDMWILIAREYNEDPVVKTMLPSDWLSARRRTILMFHDRGGDAGVERLAISRYSVDGLFASQWNRDEEPDQWKALGDIVAARAPEKIAVNFSRDFALADGISHSEHQALIAALGDDLAARVVSGEGLAIGWLETRILEEMEIYPDIVAIAHGIIAEGFSRRAITPGLTTAEDLQWWYRSRIRELGLVTWFHPSIAIQRAGEADRGFVADFTDTEQAGIIGPGDLLHVDFGITYLGLNTDTQQHAYVLRPGETEAPAGLVEALAAANRLQDILTAEFKAGRTGNEILSAARQKALDEGLTPAIYTHPIGYHGHGAGPTIGLWDQQDGVPGRGDYPLHADTAYSIELNATVAIPEWDGKEIRVMLEEDAFFDGRTVRYIDGRQTEFYLIPGD